LLEQGTSAVNTKKIHLVCNAHIDPVWLWEWEEGASAALSTFRAAADLCEKFDAFVFNHNEAILYEWVEEHEPALHERIKRLVKTGRWHIAGGWYLQPDCNMLSGESFVRQILLGRSYFRKKFGARPRTAINLDPFGHTRGLVQIVAKSGYDSYLFCRPSFESCDLPAPEFTWVGYDGSTVTGTLATTHYNSSLGKARSKVKQWIADHPEKKTSILLWGVGNHGGGPSRIDLEELAVLMRDDTGFEIAHSTPENYFAELGHTSKKLQRHEHGINPWAPGCYTSMARVKQKHRQLESSLYMTEKMASVAAFQGLIPYPDAELGEACRDLAKSGFHDVLPGSSTQPVEEASVRTMDHGLELLSRVRARAFFSLAAGLKRARRNEIPVLVFNPHPWKLKATVECEMQPDEPNQRGGFFMPTVFSRGKALPCQVEKEASNLNHDFRKRVVFRAELEPGAMNRFDCRIELLPEKPRGALKVKKGGIRFKTEILDVVLNTKTGLMDRYRVKGKNYLEEGAFRPLVIHDNPDSWGTRARRFRKPAGRFRLMSSLESARFSGVDDARLPPVRVIEDGPVRSVIETVFAYNSSFICQQYTLPKEGSEIEVSMRVYWNEKDRMLKLSIPTLMSGPEYMGQQAFGSEMLKNNGDEVVAQQWTAALSRSSDKAITVINSGIHGSDMAKSEVRLSLLRSPCYAGLEIEGRPICAQDRFTPRMDQGERLFRFWINAGPVEERLSQVDKEAVTKNEIPFALACFPSGDGVKPKAGARVSDDAIQVSAMKKAEEGSGLVVRLFNPTGKKRTFTLSLPFVSMRKKVTLGAFEVRTLLFVPGERGFSVTNLIEELL